MPQPRTLSLAAATLAALLSAAGAAYADNRAPKALHAGAPHHQARHAQRMHHPSPPPPRHERASSAPRRGMVWSQGYWQWRGQRYAWVPGHWQAVRQGQHYRQPRWEQRAGQWHFTSGGWRHSDAPMHPGHPHRR